MSTSLPDRTNGSTGIVDAATTSGQQKTNLGNLRDFIADLFGTTTAALRTVWEAFRLHGPATLANASLSFSVAANALTINVRTRAGATPSATDPVLLGQRSATAGNGDFNLRAVTAATSLVVSSGSTLGLGNADSTFVYVYLLDNAGTQELAISQAWFGASGIVSTTAEGGAGAADSASVMYSASARSNVPFRALARLQVPQTTAGAYTALPTACQLWPFDPPALVPRGHLAGLTLSTAGSSTTMTVAAGQAADSANAVLMSLTAAVGKTTGSWAVGSGNGGLDAGTIANNTWYHWHLIRRPDTGVVDVLCSLSATAPTLPSNYTQSRRIGSGKTNGSGQWVAFVQDGDYFRLSASVLDVNAANPGTSAVTRTLASVPTGVNVHAELQVATNGGSTNAAAHLSDLAAADEAPSYSAAPLATVGGNFATGSAMTVQARVRTDTSAQIRTRINASGGGQTLYIATLGWWDRRGRDA